VLTAAGWQPDNGERFPSCPPALRQEILARVAARKPIVPDALARQIVVAPAFVKHHRNPRAAVLDYISAAGTQMWRNAGEDGEREFVKSADIVECDDATINFPVCVPWAIRGCPVSERYEVKVGRFQWLVAIDVGSRKILGYCYTARPRGSYRGEDVLSLMRTVIKQHGIVRAWRMERGIWESNLVKDAARNMGADRLTVHSPHAKPFIEGLFNSLWTRLSSHFPFSDVGRYRAENQESNRLLVACQSGAQDPRRHLPMLADALAAFDQVIAEHNEHLIDSDNYGCWVPNERWEADTAARPLPRLAPESEWLFNPFARTWTVKGNTVSGRVPLFEGVSIPYVFSAPWLLEYHGAKVRAHFDPSEPRCCAKIVLAESTAGHREGEVLGDAWQINETTAYARLAMGCGQSSERREGLEQIRQASAALRRVAVGIVGPKRGDNFQVPYIEREERDGLGALSRLTQGAEAAPALVPPPPPPAMPPVAYTSRVGKIARLPLAIREQLNKRLLDGESGKTLLVWLNGLLDVQAVLGREFNGASISKQNLSEWRRGGFADFLQTNAAREQGDKPALPSPSPRWCPAGPDF
jgi:transposase InsO family protein